MVLLVISQNALKVCKQKCCNIVAHILHLCNHLVAIRCYMLYVRCNRVTERVPRVCTSIALKF